MPQVDLIIDTYLHAPGYVVAPAVAEPALARRLWPRWPVTISQDRGVEGIRWVIEADKVSGTTEVWIEQFDEHSCCLHTFVRADPHRRRPAWLNRWHARRLRAAMSRVLWQFKDEVESRQARLNR